MTFLLASKLTRALGLDVCAQRPTLAVGLLSIREIRAVFLDCALPPVPVKEPNHTITPYALLAAIEEPDAPFMEYLLLRLVKFVPYPPRL